MHTYHEATVTELHRAMTRSLTFTKRADVDDDISISVARHNVLAVADCFEWDFPLHHLWYSKARWGALCSQYLDKGAMEFWLDSISKGMAVKKNARGIALLRTNLVNSYAAGRGTTNDRRRTPVATRMPR
jgi:hypothetical protein